MSKRSLIVGATVLSLAASTVFPTFAQSTPDGVPPAAATQPPTDATVTGTGVTPAETPAAEGAAATAGSEVAAATTPSVVPSAYLTDPNRLTDGAIESWLADPRKLLEDNLRGGGRMIEFVKALAGSDSRTVAALIDLAKMADVRDAHITAMGIGLARATQEAQTIAPNYAAYIQLSVASSGSSELILAYETALGDQPTAALGLGGGGGPAGTSPGGGSLTGGGEAGPAGAINGDDIVDNIPPTSNSAGRSSVSFTEEDDDGLGSANGGSINCTLDQSPTGSFSCTF